MGGMFDPVHYGHLQTARNILQHLDLDEVRLLPCGSPVHREAVMASAEQRLAMLELALDADPRLRIDDRECRSQAPSYTYNTLAAIREEQPDSRLYYIMGQDAFNAFDTWYRWREILELSHVVVAARPGYEPDLAPEVDREYGLRMTDSVAALKRRPQGAILVTRFALLDISSSLVRERIGSRQPIDDLLPSSVAAYIRANGLYTTEVTP